MSVQHRVADLAIVGASGTADVLWWVEERRRAQRCDVTRVQFDALEEWDFDPRSGNLSHRSGRFFRIEGLDVGVNVGPVRHWQQPIICQPEIGILGILVRRVHGEVFCLMQAKTEPGNVNGLQLSPTVQATRSNYTRVHRGSTTRYLEYFTEPGRGNVLVDVLLSEQGAWFLCKRNRNMVVEVTDEPPSHEDFRWVAVPDLNRLFLVDNLINMDARSVLACLTAVLARDAADVGSDFGRSLAHSFQPEAGTRHSTIEVLSWFTDLRSRYELTVSKMPLSSLDRWTVTDREIAHEANRHFTVIGVDVSASSREVSGWTQPMLMPRGQGVVAFVARQFDGVVHVLVNAAVQPGLADVVEMGPTVQCRPENHQHLTAADQPLFLDLVLSAGRERVWYDSILSEEGGRFFHAENRYLVVEAPPDLPDEPPPGYLWLTPGQVAVLLRHSQYVNVEARTLLACLYSLCRRDAR